MKRCLARLTLLTLLGATLSAAPFETAAQTTNQIPTEKKAAAQSSDLTTTEKPAKGGPFHGRLAALDKITKTIVVGKRTFRITSETKVKKGGKPATLDDGVVGEMVSGYVKPSADGKLVATMVNFGPKATPEATEKQKAPPQEKQTK